jgi:Tfp pilus assembly protein PilF
MYSRFKNTTAFLVQSAVPHWCIQYSLGMKKLISLLIIMLCGSCAVPQIVILKDPLTAEEHINLGYLYEKQGKLDLAEEEYKKAIRKDKKNYLAYFNLGNIYAQRGEYEKAERQYRKALKLKEDPDVLNNLAYVLSKQGKKEEALLYIKKALEMKDDPSYRETLEEILKKE